MYEKYFQLRQLPFSIAPDPHYLFMSERHREALAHLLYGVGSGGGFVLLTGEIGAGKTTVCRCFIEQVPSHCKLAYIFNPKLTVPELLQSVCEEYAIAVPAGAAGVKAYVDAINAFLLDCHAKGLNNVLIIDEAQNLDPEVLEQLRLLTNLETNERKLLQIILIGQPELRDMLHSPGLEQLAQRVIARYHLGPLTAPETGSYVQHRLAVAGSATASPFPSALTPLLHRLTGGVPRRINVLCDRALLGAYAENRQQVTRGMLRKAAAEVFGQRLPPRRLLWWIAPAIAGMAAVAAAFVWTPSSAPKPTPAAAVVRPAAPERLLVHDSEAAALAELAKLWDAPQAVSCDGKSALHCYQARGGLFDVRTLDRPAVLTLHDGKDTRYALVVGLDDTRAILQAGGKRQTVGLAQLAGRFDGEIQTLWKSGRSFRDELRSGDKGPDVDALAASIAHLAGQDAPAAGSKFGTALATQVRALQIQSGLKADGVAGPRTFIRLNQLAGADEPKLLKP